MKGALRAGAGVLVLVAPACAAPGPGDLDEAGEAVVRHFLDVAQSQYPDGGVSRETNSYAIGRQELLRTRVSDLLVGRTGRGRTENRAP